MPEAGSAGGYDGKKKKIGSNILTIAADGTGVQRVSLEDGEFSRGRAVVAAEGHPDSCNFEGVATGEVGEGKAAESSAAAVVGIEFKGEGLEEKGSGAERGARAWRAVMQPPLE